MRQRLGRRESLMALLIAVPAVLTAGGVVTLEGWRFLRPHAPLFAAPTVDSLADAIASNDVRQAYRFIHDGQDPNELIAVRHPVLTGGEQVEVSPLLWAVATQSDRSALVLFGYGAHMEAAAARQAVCLAEHLERDDIARLLERLSGHVSVEPCPTQQANDAVLLEALAERE